MSLTELEESVVKAASAYYAGNPIMSDEEFDILISNLPAESKLPSQTGWGGSELLASSDKTEIKHRSHIGGLPKTKYNGEEATIYEITHKLDGITGVAYYDGRGNLEYVLTRGDGNVGIKVDAELNIPKSYHPNAEIRGEIVVEFEDWELLLQKGDYKHPRNAAAGIVMSKSRDLDEYLTFIAYDWINSPHETQTESLLDMEDAFTCLSPIYSHDESDYDNESHIGGTTLPWKEVIPNHFVVVDGSVWSHVKTGEAKAFKYENLEVETTVTKVEWIESDRGRLHPTVHIEPVELDGATISKASGKSGKFIVDSKIGVGAKILIRRANNVIPDIVSVLESASTINLPQVDYYWEGANMRMENGRSLREQLQDVCRQMILAKSKKGIAEKAVNQFAILSDSLDDCQMNLDEKVGKTYNSVEQGMAAALMSTWSNFELILFCKIDGIGKRAATSYLNGEASDRISHLLNSSELYSKVLSIYKPSENFPKGFIQDDEDTGQVKVCITGSLEGYTKKSFSEKYDLRLVDIKDADIVIASDNTTAKAKKADKLGKTILTQQQFESL